MSSVYHVREWLNKEGVNATSQITAYCDESSYYSDKNEIQTFEEKKLSISDCYQSIRIHQTPQMSDQDFINKIRLIAKVCDDFANYLEGI